MLPCDLKVCAPFPSDPFHTIDTHVLVADPFK